MPNPLKSAFQLSIKIVNERNIEKTDKTLIDCEELC